MDNLTAGITWIHTGMAMGVSIKQQHTTLLIAITVQGFVVASNCVERKKGEE